MLRRSVEFYCDECGTRIDGVTFFNVILGVVYHYHPVCFELEISGVKAQMSLPFKEGGDDVALSSKPD